MYRLGRSEKRITLLKIWCEAPAKTIDESVYSNTQCISLATSRTDNT